MRSEIILIGPSGAGKSTTGKLLAQALGVSQCSLDDLRIAYYKEVGFTEDEQKRIKEAEGFYPGVYRYWKGFQPHSIKRALETHPGCVFDLGAGCSVYEDQELLDSVRSILEPFKNVVLILPSEDPGESVRILRKRTWDGIVDGFDFHTHFVTHPSNYLLAKKIVYTKGKIPEETRDEILAITKD
jgi:hypothetical protein